MSNYTRAPASQIPTPAGFRVRLAGLVALVGQSYTRWLKAREGRRALFALTQLDDHFLRDIGVTRADVDAALLSENVSDPSLVLGERRATAHDGSIAVKREAIVMARTGA